MTANCKSLLNVYLLHFQPSFFPSWNNVADKSHVLRLFFILTNKDIQLLRLCQTKKNTSLLYVFASSLTCNLSKSRSHCRRQPRIDFGSNFAFRFPSWVVRSVFGDFSKKYFLAFCRDFLEFF